MTSQEYYLGIDLGTTYCCTSIYRNGKVEVIPNCCGNRTTPSYISFTDTERLIGESAKNNVSLNSKNTVFDIKRLIGRQFDDKYVQNDLKYFPFKVSCDEKTKKPLITVNYMNEEKQYYPEQLSAMLLQQFKYDAEEYLGTTITKAVITVPAYFNNAQRQSTKDAGEIAGLEVIRIINEPTSSAIAYGFNLCENDKSQNKNILVFDFGGGTLDVSILNILDGVFEVKSTSGDTHLGGEDIDNKLVAFCTCEFAKLNKLTEQDSKKLIEDSRALRRLRSVCENAKKTLSNSISTVIQVESFFNSIDLVIKITRAKLEELSHDIFQRCLIPLDNAINDAKLTKENITEVILIGGSTRIPYVRNMLKEYFNGKQLKTDINPDEAVSFGAAIQAAILSGKTDKNINDLVLIDVAPLSLGIEISHGEMSKIVERNTPIPCQCKQYYSTETDNQRIVKIKIFEGERILTKDNSSLGIFELTDLPPMPRGIPKISVVFDIDANGILNVTASEISTGKTNNITIKRDNSKLSRDDILKFIDNAKENADLDEKIKATFMAKNALEGYLYSIKHALETLNVTNLPELTMIQSLLINGYKWYDLNQLSSADTIHNKHIELEKIITPLLKKLYDEKAKITQEQPLKINNETSEKSKQEEIKQEESKREEHIEEQVVDIEQPKEQIKEQLKEQTKKRGRPKKKL